MKKKYRSNKVKSYLKILFPEVLPMFLTKDIDSTKPFLSFYKFYLIFFNCLFSLFISV